MFLFFFFNDTATTEIYTLSLHDALPIYRTRDNSPGTIHRTARPYRFTTRPSGVVCRTTDRKSTRLNSSHLVISYAVFCLKKKKNAKSRPEEGNQQPHPDARARRRDITRV